MKNVADSIRQRLLNISRKENRGFQELVQYFAMYRFLTRLSSSKYRNRFILKGALLMHVLKLTNIRTTLDIDLLGQISNNPDNIHKAIETIINTKTEQDRLRFLKETIHISDITPNAEYDGRRVGIVCRLGVMKIPIQIDIGFGDTIFPTPVEMPLPRDFDSASILCYSPETSIAEKAHAMLDRGVLNSRMKDFYDVWILSESIDLREEILAEAISETFSTRKTVIDTESIVFTEAFFNDGNKQKQWSAFLRKRNIFNAPEHFHDIARDVMEFLKPILIKAKFEY